MRPAPLVIALTIVGCTDPGASHVSFQPLVVVDVEAAPAEAPATESDDLFDNPVGGVERIGLADPTRVIDSSWISIEPSDYSTATRGVQPTLVFGPDAPEADVCMESGECLRLVTYPERDPVDAEVVSVEPSHGDTSRRLTLVPRRELSDRWYAVEIDLERDVHEAFRSGAHQLARFRPDSAPVLTHALLNGRGELELRFSERVSGDVPAAHWRVEDASGPIECGVRGPDPERPETRAVFSCRRPFEGRVVISPGTGLRTVLGTELRDEDWAPLDRFVIGEDATAAASRSEAVVRVPLYSL